MVGIIGCGNMGEALVKGLRKKSKKKKVFIFDKDKKKSSLLKRRYKVDRSNSIEELIRKSDVIIIAVKPQDIKSVLKTVGNNYKKEIIISIAAGITTSFIEKSIGGRPLVIRAMPNLAAKVSMGVTALCRGKFASRKDLGKARRLFQASGSCIEMPEKYMDSVTALAGSGPGYMYYFLESLEKAGRDLGFSKKVSKALVLSMAKGAVNLISDKDDFSDLVKKVASKGGTTEAALKHLKKQKIQDSISSAVKRASDRAADLRK